MDIKRDRLYRFPWSRADNPGGWVEVTDECDLQCPGCFRHKIEGHRTLEDVEADILVCQDKLNSDRMAISGGEPLLYPQIVEVVKFIARQGMKPMILTNGRLLTKSLALELKKAGLAQFYFHVDSGQNRPNWEGKNEVELNELRQYFADLVWEIGGIQCGYNTTVFRSTLYQIPMIMDWGRKNIRKVQHISFIAFRGLISDESVQYTVENQIVDLHGLENTCRDSSKIDLSTNEMFEILEAHFPEAYPCAYLNGTAVLESFKFLILINIGSGKKIFGGVGAKTVEMVQVFYHLIKGRYCAFLSNPNPGKKIFILSFFDKTLKHAFKEFLRYIVKNPVRFFDRLYVQCINIQQPHEIQDGQVNLCDGCLNLMIYEGNLINSCRLDEYRIFGGALTPHQREESAIHQN
jgi:hypothetical protein